jgi:hypothetical protein
MLRGDVWRAPGALVPPARGSAKPCSAPSRAAAASKSAGATMTWADPHRSAERTRGTTPHGGYTDQTNDKTLRRTSAPAVQRASGGSTPRRSPRTTSKRLASNAPRCRFAWRKRACAARGPTGSKFVQGERGDQPRRALAAHEMQACSADGTSRLPHPGPSAGPAATRAGAHGARRAAATIAVCRFSRTRVAARARQACRRRPAAGRPRRGARC